MNIMERVPTDNPVELAKVASIILNATQRRSKFLDQTEYLFLKSTFINPLSSSPTYIKRNSKLCVDSCGSTYSAQRAATK